MSTHQKIQIVENLLESRHKTPKGEQRLMASMPCSKEPKLAVTQLPEEDYQLSRKQKVNKAAQHKGDLQQKDISPTLGSHHTYRHDHSL